MKEELLLTKACGFRSLLLFFEGSFVIQKNCQNTLPGKHRRAVAMRMTRPARILFRSWPFKRPFKTIRWAAVTMMPAAMIFFTQHKPSCPPRHMCQLCKEFFFLCVLPLLDAKVKSDIAHDNCEILTLVSSGTRDSLKKECLNRSRNRNSFPACLPMRFCVIMEHSESCWLIN